MKKSSVSGWRDVFSFTLRETLKNKAYQISFLIMALLALVSMPLVQYLTGNIATDSEEISAVKKVYIHNLSTVVEPDFTSLKEEPAYRNVEFVNLTEDYDTVAQRIQETEDTSVLLTIAEANGGYQLNFEKSAKGPVKDGAMSAFADKVYTAFDKYRLSQAGITEEQNNILHTRTEGTTLRMDANGNFTEEKNSAISMNEYWFIYGILFFLMMVTIMASSQVASSVVTEKANRVVEYLLISVRPLALMVGKVLAMLSAVLIQITSLLIVVFVSNRISAALAGDTQAGVMNQLVPANIFENLNIINLILGLILIALGLIFYAVLAGLAGATVSKMEELNEGMTMLTLTSMVGVYIGIIAANMLMGSGTNGFVTFAFLFPLSSPFILPGAILIGKANYIIAGGAILLLIILNILMFKFVAGIYETLILHNGNRIKPTDLFKVGKGGIKA